VVAARASLGTPVHQIMYVVEVDVITIERVDRVI